MFKKLIPFRIRKFQLIYFLKWVKKRIFVKNKYVTEKWRLAFPTDARNIHPNLIDNTQDVAIIVRGNPIKHDNFSINTLKFYRKSFPKAEIYYTTWIDFQEYFKNFAHEYDIKMIYSEDIGNIEGYANFNRQIFVVREALKKVLNNKKYTLITRSDQRIYMPNLLIFLKEYSEIYPLSQNIIDSGTQNKRLIALNFNSMLYRPYSLSDMFLFGETNDVYNFWKAKLDQRIFKNQIKYSNNIEYSKQRVCEVYLMTEFLKSIGHEPKWTIKDYWNVLKERFIIVDSNILDLLWPKYNEMEDRWNFASSPFTSTLENSTNQQFTFSDWLLIKKNHFLIDEDLLYKKI